VIPILIYSNDRSKSPGLAKVFCLRFTCSQKAVTRPMFGLFVWFLLQNFLSADNRPTTTTDLRETTTIWSGVTNS
jgi:hypothetical protein